jgi:hypothetical protein
MILPNKHIEAEKSLLSVGAVIIQNLDRPRSITGLWKRISVFPGVRTFERFTLALDLLYAIGAVEFEEDLLQRRYQ